MSLPPTRLADLADRLGRTVEGDGDFLVEGAGSLEQAGPSEIGFVGSAKWAAALEGSKVGAVILPEGIDPGGRPAIRSPTPRLDFSRALNVLYPESRPAPGVHASAVVSPEANVAPDAAVGPRSVIGAGCVVGARSVIHANVTLYPDVEIGDDCTLHSGCVLREGTRLGHRVILQPGAILGGDGFGYEGNEEGMLERVPQVGVVVLEDDVEIGANTTVDRAALGQTRIGRGTKVDNLVMLAHNVRVGESGVIVAQAGIAGSSKLGDRVVVLAQAGIADHTLVGDGATVGPQAGIFGEVPPGETVWGWGVQLGFREFFRVQAAMKRLPEALKRIARLERKLRDGGEGGE